MASLCHRHHFHRNSLLPRGCPYHHEQIVLPFLFNCLQLHCLHFAPVDCITLIMGMAIVQNFVHLLQSLLHPHITHTFNTQLHNHGILFSCNMQPFALGPPLLDLLYDVIMCNDTRVVWVKKKFFSIFTIYLLSKKKAGIALPQINLAGNVGNMSATCRRQGKMSPIFVPTGQFWRHGLQCVGTLCVTISQHCRTKYRQHMYVGKYIDESILSNSQRISTCLLSSALSAHTKFCICTLP